MKELIEFNRQILAECPPEFSEEYIAIDSDMGVSLWPGASEVLWTRAEALRSELDLHMPEYFFYTILLGPGEVIMLPEYEKDEELISCPELIADEKRTIAEFFSTIDWEEQRRVGLEETAAMAGQAPDLATMIEEDLAKMPADPMPLPTKKLQQACRDEMKAWVKEKRHDETKVFVLMCNEDGELFDEEYETKKDFQEAFAEIFFYEEVVAIVMDGKPVPAKQIDKMRVAAMDLPLRKILKSGDEVSVDESDESPDANS